MIAMITMIIIIIAITIAVSTSNYILYKVNYSIINIMFRSFQIVLLFLHLFLSL